eukprot:scaffold116763_cov27-Prasinocladus_malaysianus.AAC.1
MSKHNLKPNRFQPSNKNTGVQSSRQIIPSPALSPAAVPPPPAAVPISAFAACLVLRSECRDMRHALERPSELSGIGREFEVAQPKGSSGTRPAET